MQLASLVQLEQDQYSVSSRHTVCREWGGPISSPTALSSPSFSQRYIGLMAGDPKNWSKVKSSEGQTFYYNRVTKAVQWEKPKMRTQESQGSNDDQGEPQRPRKTSIKTYGVWNNKV